MDVKRRKLNPPPILDHRVAHYINIRTGKEDWSCRWQPHQYYEDHLARRVAEPHRWYNTNDECVVWVENVYEK